MVSNDLGSEQIFSPTRLREVVKIRKQKMQLFKVAKKIVAKAIDEVLEGEREYTETEEYKVIIELYFRDLKSDNKESEDEQRIREVFENKNFPEEKFVNWLNKEQWKFEKFINSITTWYAIVEK